MRLGIGQGGSGRKSVFTEKDDEDWTLKKFTPRHPGEKAAAVNFPSGWAAARPIQVWYRGVSMSTCLIFLDASQGADLAIALSIKKVSVTHAMPKQGAVDRRILSLKRGEFFGRNLSEITSGAEKSPYPAKLVKRIQATSARIPSHPWKSRRWGAGECGSLTLGY